MASLNKIYSLVLKDLETVETSLKEVGRVNYPPMAKMLEYCLTDGGKRIRPALVLLSGKFYHYDLATLIPMATAVELLHTATLVHDDAVDSSAIRRGKPTINVTWDDDKAVLLGDYLFAKAEDLTASTGNLRVIRLCAETLQIITSGEINQAFNSFNIKQTREDYIKRIAAKTASLLSTTTTCGAVLSGAPEESVVALRDYGYYVGIAFQLVDDILDYVGTEKELGKPIASDLSQGTLTLPAMMLLERYPENNPVSKIFKGENNPENINRAVQMVRDSTIVEDCFKLASDYVEKGCKGLSCLPDNASRDALHLLADYILKRRK